MIKIPDPILILFVLTSVVGFLFRFIKDGSYKQLGFAAAGEKLGTFALVILPFVGLFLLGQQFKLPFADTLPYFAGAAGLSFVLGALGLPSYLRGILLLGATVALTVLAHPGAVIVALASTLCGLLAVKLSENLAFKPESDFDDVLPSFIWLTSVMWLVNAESPKVAASRAAVVLGIMSVSLFMRFVQGPFVRIGNKNDDRFFLKRVVLSVTAGLAVLCVVIKLLNLVELQYLAILCGAAYFITYIYKDLSGEDRYALGGQQAIRMLIFIGVLTIVASRFFGSFGLLAMAPAAMVAPLSSAALFPGLFFAARVLLQVFIQNYNQNVTGINLNHAYAGAAQYGGFLLGIILMLLFKERMNRKVLLSLSLGACIVTPILSNFILHAEPTCSLFVATTVSCVLLSIMAPALQNGRSNGSENLMLMPPLMVSTGILTSQLLEQGGSASIAVKMTVLSYGIVFVLASMFIFWFFFQRPGKAPATPVSTEGA